MRYLSYIVVLLVMACGEHKGSNGSVRHLFDNGAQDGKKSIIFATKQPNDQHCFYGRNIASEVSQESVSADKEAILKLAQGSVLLTPRSLSHKDVRRALLADTKESNIVDHLLFNPVSLPLSLTCFVSSTVFLFGNVAMAIISGAGAALTMVTLGKVAAVSCGTEIAIYAGAVFFSFDSASTSRFASRKLVSSHLHSTSTDELERLRKIFTWLDSRDAMQCPATLQLPMQTESKDKQKQMRKEGK